MIIRRRYHPLTMGYQLFQFFKGMFFLFLFFFLIKLDSEELYVQIGQIVLIIWSITYMIYIFLKWLTWKYTLDDEAFHFYKGIFVRSVQTIPITKIQNTQHHKTFFHRLFGVTSVKFDTGMSGEDSAIYFQIISLHELEQMEAHIEQVLRNQHSIVNLLEEIQVESIEDSKVIPVRKLHFQATKKDVFKATFTSLSFLVMIPILFSLYFKVDEIFDMEKEVGVFLSKIFSSWISGLLVVGGLVIFSFIVGLISTYIRYGKYEIYSDEKFIYIQKGVLTEMRFSIAKERVQAIEIRQTLVKKWLGLAEVRLVSAGIQSEDAEKLDVNSLYPFLPYQRAIEMMRELLPMYELTSNVKKLPSIAIYKRMIPPIIGVLVGGMVAVVSYMQQWDWIMYGAIIFIVLCMIKMVVEIMDVCNTRYVANGSFFQVQKGVLLVSLFLSSRQKMIEVKIKRSLLQRLFHLATFEVANRANPVHRSSLHDVSFDVAKELYAWYMKRIDEIEIE